jgi:anti-sigma factor RsiW
MSCSSPVSWEDLVAYWAGDLAPVDEDRVDEHLMGCGSCSAESARVSAVAEALRARIPPVVSRARLEELRAQGMRIRENVFAPGQRQTAVFPPEVDLLVHRLAGFDLSNAARVAVKVFVESTGELLIESPDAPFDVRDGVLIACQRHFAMLPADISFEVRAIETSGAEHTAVYAVPHLFQP